MNLPTLVLATVMTFGCTTISQVVYVGKKNMQKVKDAANILCRIIVNKIIAIESNRKIYQNADFACKAAYS